LSNGWSVQQGSFAQWYDKGAPLLRTCSMVTNSFTSSLGTGSKAECYSKATSRIFVYMKVTGVKTTRKAVFFRNQSQVRCQGKNAKDRQMREVACHSLKRIRQPRTPMKDMA